MALLLYQTIIAVLPAVGPGSKQAVATPLTTASVGNSFVIDLTLHGIRAAKDFAFLHECASPLPCRAAPEFGPLHMQLAMRGEQSLQIRLTYANGGSHDPQHITSTCRVHECFCKRRVAPACMSAELLLICTMCVALSNLPAQSQQCCSPRLHLAHRSHIVHSKCSYSADAVALVLYESDYTWAASLHEKKDTCEVKALAISSQRKQQPVLWTAKRLPSDAFAVAAAPSGGAVILSPSLIIYQNKVRPHICARKAVWEGQPPVLTLRQRCQSVMLQRRRSRVFKLCSAACISARQQ